MLTLDDKIKIIDLGSCYIYKDKQITNHYVQSRYYRAPEVVLGCKFDFGIDIWSFGCIVYELLTGKPLFGGKSERDLIGRITSIIGMPPKEIFIESGYVYNFFLKQNEEVSLVEKTDKRNRAIHKNTT